LPLETMEAMPELHVMIYDQDGRAIEPEQTAPARPGVARDTPLGSVVVEPSPIQALSGLVTSPTEATVLVGTTRHFESAARAHQGSEMALPLQFLYFTTQSFLPGVRWDAHTHPYLVFSFIGLMLLASTVSGLLCFLLPRRYAIPRVWRIVWGMVGFLFGWAGLFLMLALQEWPARIVCPKCRGLRVVTRDTCEHCGATHAIPAPDGTEIFESTATMQQTALTAS
jgi:hypothetical protein